VTRRRGALASNAAPITWKADNTAADIVLDKDRINQWLSQAVRLILFRHHPCDGLLGPIERFSLAEYRAG
jgi:hypothetical protein